MKILSILLLLAVAGCAGTAEVPVDNYEIEFGITIDKLTTPETVAPDQPLVIALDAFIGSNGCYRFDRAEIEAKTDRWELAFFGIHDTDPDIMCTQALVEWRGREFTKEPPHSGAVEIVIRQPDGSTLKRTVPVK